MYGCLDSALLQHWNAVPSETEHRFTIKIDSRLVRGAPDVRKREAREAATLLLSLPWELLYDESGYVFRSGQQARVCRSIPNRNPQPALAAKEPLRILVVTPRPEDEFAAYTDHRSSSGPLVEALSALGDLAEFTILDPPTFPALEAELKASQAKPYQIVHFDGQGVSIPHKMLTHYALKTLRTARKWRVGEANSLLRKASPPRSGGIEWPCSSSKPARPRRLKPTRCLRCGTPT